MSINFNVSKSQIYRKEKFSYLPSLIAATIVAKLSSVSTILAASIVSSVAVLPIAILKDKLSV